MRIDEILKRAIAASSDERRVRTAQLSFHAINWILAQGKRSILPEAGHLRSLRIQRDQISDWWESRNHSWFLDSRRRDEIRSHYSAHENHRTRMISRAELVMSGKMPLFSHAPVDFTDRDRWQRDPILDVRAPNKFYGRIRYLDRQTVGDSKYVWEPNRAGWAYWLGAAFIITGNERYAEKFCELARDWFARNLYPRGINYCSSLEMAIRGYAWIWALDLFTEHLAHDPDLLEKFLHGMWIAGCHIERTLSHYFAPNTHLLGEAFYLFVCGAAIPEFREAPRWRQIGAAILVQEARRQLHDDGTHRELSTCYHLYTTDIYLHACAIAQRCGVSLDEPIVDAAERLAIRLYELSPPELVLPQLNDCDGGRLTGFCLQTLDAAPSLAMAAGLFEGFEANAASRHAHGDNLWMIPHANLPLATRNHDVMATEAGGHERGRVHDSGIATYQNPAGDFLVFRASPFGYMSCGHSHDAPTSFILHFAGRPVIVDNGTGSYTQSADTRNRFRCASGKNIVLIDGRGPSDPGGWFDWKEKTDSTLTLERKFADGFLCQGTHEGYGKAVGSPIKIWRSIVLFDDGVVVVFDSWRAAHPVHCLLYLTLAPNLVVDPDRQLIRGAHGQVYYYTSQQFGSGYEPVSAKGNFEEIAWEARSSDHYGSLSDRETVCTTATAHRVPYSPNYGTIEDTTALACDFGSSPDGIWVTVLSRDRKVSTVLLQSRLNDSGIMPLVAAPWQSSTA